MKTENKYTLMVWAIVILTVMNISTVATIVYHKYQSEKAETIAVSDQKQLETDSEKFSGRYFRDQLNLSREQMDKFKEINPVFRPKARDITIELAQKRKQMLIEMAAAKSDTARLNALSDSIGQLHSNLKKITYRYYLEIKSICDPEQQRKLEQIFGEMFTNDSQLGYPGKGGPRGGRQGKRFNN
ncbi:MAG: periplasmic heavy metal sensor [Bacteroidia bacterium]|nr:periplasmic heavy metal sensor [Bacteroidia bacterium]